jgi:hypothetical protein
VATTEGPSDEFVPSFPSLRPEGGFDPPEPIVIVIDAPGVTENAVPVKKPPAPPPPPFFEPPEPPPAIHK